MEEFDDQDKLMLPIIIINHFTTKLNSLLVVISKKIINAYYSNAAIVTNYTAVTLITLFYAHVWLINRDSNTDLFHIWIKQLYLRKQ